MREIGHVFEGIIEQKKIAIRSIEKELRQHSESRGEKIEIVEVKLQSLVREDASIVDEVNNIDLFLCLLRQNKKTSDLLMGFTVIHNLLVQSLWQYNIVNTYGKLDTNNCNDTLNTYSVACECTLQPSNAYKVLSTFK